MKLPRLECVALPLALAAGGMSAFPASACPKIGVAEGGAYAGETVELVRTIFQEAGQCVDVLLAPQMRIDLMERQGALDGDAWRDDLYLNDNPSLAKAPTPVQHFSVSLYWRKDSPDPASAPGITVGILASRPWARDALRGIPATLFEATSYRQLLQLARTGRIQALVMPTLTFAKLAEEEKEGLPLFQSREMFSRPFYLALQKRNAGMIPALNEAIRTLWAKGTISDLPPPQR